MSIWQEIDFPFFFVCNLLSHLLEYHMVYDSILKMIQTVNIVTLELYEG